MKQWIFYTIQEITEFYKYITENVKDIELLSIDTETDSLDILTATIYQIPIAFKFKDGRYESYLLDIYKLIKNKTTLKEIKSLVKNILVYIQTKQKIENYKIIYHNGKYDGGVLKNFLDFTIEFENTEDTLFLAQNLQRGYFWDTPFDIGMSFGLKPLSERLELKKKSQEGFKEIYEALEQKNWHMFEPFFKEYIKTNKIVLNKFEQQKLLEQDIEWFTILFINPEDLVTNLKKLRKQYITNAMHEFLENRKTRYIKKYSLYKNKSYFNMTEDYKNPYNRDELLEEFLQEFNVYYFKIPKSESSAFFSYDISYLELYEISSLVLSTYALMDGKLTILLYEELQKRLQGWLNNNIADKNERTEEIKKIERNYKMDRTINYGLIMAEETGYYLDIKYVLESLKELKEAIYEDTLLQNKFLLPILNYYIKNPNIPFIQKQENIKRDIGITLVEGKQYTLTEDILKNTKTSILDLDVSDEDSLFEDDNIDDGAFETIKSTEHEKNKDFFAEYLSYLKLPIHVSKDPNKLDTYKKFLKVLKLKEEDEEVYNEIINHRFNQTALSEPTIFFTKANPIYEKLKTEFSKLYSYGIIDVISNSIMNFIRGDEDIFEDIGSKWRKSIFNNFSNIIKKLTNEMLKRKFEYSLQQVERNYLNSLSSKVDRNSLPKTHINKINTLQRKFVKDYFNTKENQEIENMFNSINTFVFNNVENLLDEMIILDEGVPESIKKETLSTINPYIKSLEISFKYPKRTLNKETIQKIMENKNDYLSNSEWNDEQKLSFESLIEYLLLKKKISTYMKYYGNYAWNFAKAHATNLDKRIKFSYKNIGAFTGRLSGNGQQMPNDGVTAYSNPKYTLFNPRKAIIPSDDSQFMFAVDFDNIENVTMAEGTLVHGFLDEALAKIYVPYGAVNEKGELFDFKKHRYIIKRHKWYYKDNNLWIPSDFHTETTRAAFPQLFLDLNAKVTMVNPLTGVTETLMAHKFADLYRKKVAKPINFGYPYGQSLQGMINANRNVPKELIEKIYYSKQQTFFNTDRLKQHLADKATNEKHIYNIVGRRYTFKTDEYGRVMGSYRSLNYYAQGSAADVLKMAIKKVELYLRYANTDIKMFGNVHDEILFGGTYSKENMMHMLRLVRLMGSYNIFNMPVTAGLEIIFKSWYEKTSVDIDGYYNMTINKNDQDISIEEFRPFAKETPEFKYNETSTKVFETLMKL